MDLVANQDQIIRILNHGNAEDDVRSGSIFVGKWGNKHLKVGAEDSQESDKARGESAEAKSSDEGSNGGSDAGEKADGDTLDTIELEGKSTGADSRGGDVRGGQRWEHIGKSESSEDTSNGIEELAENIRAHALNLGVLGVGKALGVDLLQDSGNTIDNLSDKGGFHALDGGEVLDITLEASAEGDEKAHETGGEASETETSDEHADGSGDISEESAADTRGSDGSEVGDGGGLAEEGGSWGGGTEGRADEAAGGSQSIGELHCCGGGGIIKKIIDKS